MTDIHEAAAKVKAWDGKSVHALRDLIEELEDAVEASGVPGKAGQFVDFSSLPFCERVPAAVAGYPCWTVDDNGLALVGDAADQIEPLTDVLTGP